MTPGLPPAESELQAHADGRLVGERRARVEAWLAAHPDEAARIAAYRVLAEQCRAAYAPVLDEPIPAALLSKAEQRPGPAAWARRSVATAVFAALLAISAWELVPRYVGPGAHIARQAAVAHAVVLERSSHLASDHRPKDEVLAWLSAHLGMPVKAPELGKAGLAFVGAELLPGSAALAGVLLYEDQDDGRRLTIYWAPEFKQDEETGVRRGRSGAATRVYYWLDDDCGYAVASADLPDKDLLHVALIAYAQMEK